MKTTQLLSQLHWPEDAINNKGVLTFSKTVGFDLESGVLGTNTTASVIVDTDSIKLRVRTTKNGETILPVLDAEWMITNDEAAFSSLSADLDNAGYKKEQDVDAEAEQEALNMFQDHVNLLAVRPQFDKFGARQPKETVVENKPFRFNV